ncbi:MAG: sigma-70 family RNA polymerase sigma factor [Acidobacteria bacterium]|nr:sigma-70 family RNA polymerase sigma factor [Acidobacteriota bacterium]MYC83403.1 sigma-70 family RNA polymerase sigma factor [Acidobacteriota bacterium]
MPALKGPKACPWVHEIVANTAENVRRQREHRGEVASREEVDLHPGPEALAQERELLALLAEMIQMLPGTYRQILDLRLYQGLSTRQTAERLHISRAAVSTRLSRAVRLLKGRLDARLRSLSPDDSPQS